MPAGFSDSPRRHCSNCRPGDRVERDELKKWSSKARHRAGYRSWGQVGGYFDGDRSVNIDPTMFTVIVSADWADTYKPQLDHVRGFLIRNGISPSKVYALQGARPVWHLRLSNRGGLRTVLKRILPFLDKKRDQVDGALQYLENRITGGQLFERFNQATRKGTRSGFIKNVEIPFRRLEGLSLAKIVAARRSVIVPRLTTDMLKQALLDHHEFGISYRKIAEEYQTSSSSLRRALNRIEAESVARS